MMNLIYEKTGERKEISTHCGVETIQIVQAYCVNQGAFQRLR